MNMDKLCVFAILWQIWHGNTIETHANFEITCFQCFFSGVCFQMRYKRMFCHKLGSKRRFGFFRGERGLRAKVTSCSGDRFLEHSPRKSCNLFGTKIHYQPRGYSRKMPPSFWLFYWGRFFEHSFLKRLCLGQFSAIQDKLYVQRFSKTSFGRTRLGSDLSGPVLRDTARLSQRYPPIARYGVFGVSTWPIGCYTPSPFSERFPLGEHAKWRCDTPPQKGYLSDTGAIPYKNKANGCDTPLCDTISKGYCAIWGGISHWAAKVPILGASCSNKLLVGTLQPFQQSTYKSRRRSREQQEYPRDPVLPFLPCDPVLPFLGFWDLLDKF